MNDSFLLGIFKRALSLPTPNSNKPITLGPVEGEPLTPSAIGANYYAEEVSPGSFQVRVDEFFIKNSSAPIRQITSPVDNGYYTMSEAHQKIRTLSAPRAKVA